MLIIEEMEGGVGDLVWENEVDNENGVGGRKNCSGRSVLAVPTYGFLKA